MALTLEQYAAYLDTRDLPWPAAPEVDRPKAKPHLVRLPQVRAVLWNVYGTLLAVAGGELLFEHPTPFIMNNALDKTIQEFKMWASMSRKPGQPSEYMGQIYRQVLAEQRAGPGGGERHPEVAAERVWEAILKRLLQKDYKFDAGLFRIAQRVQPQGGLLLPRQPAGHGLLSRRRRRPAPRCRGRADAGAARRRPVLHTPSSSSAVWRPRIPD